MKCRICERNYHYDYSVPSGDWKEVLGNSECCVCLYCFDRIAYLKRYVYKLEFFKFPPWYRHEEIIGGIDNET